MEINASIEFHDTYDIVFRLENRRDDKFIGNFSFSEALKWTLLWNGDMGAQDWAAWRCIARVMELQAQIIRAHIDTYEEKQRIADSEDERPHSGSA